MFRGRSVTRGKAYGSRGGGTSKRSSGPKGLFADGVWQCVCTPRLPAEHFKVKKEGKNQGRWFYTCQNSESQRCDFFLWDEDAKLREEGAVLGNSRTEPEKDAQRTGRKARGGMFGGLDPISGTMRAQRKKDDDESTEAGSPPPVHSLLSTIQRDNKRTATAAGLADEDEDFLDWPLTGQEEDAMVKAADAVASFETPRKASKQGVYDTPGATVDKPKRHLPWLEHKIPDAPITPKSKDLADYFATPSKPPTMPLLHFPAEAAPTTPSAPLQIPPAQPTSPSPSTRHQDALPYASSSLTAEALAALGSVSMPPESLTKLRTLLTQHDLRTQGIVKGRDISRLGLQAKDAKIAELLARIASLEAEREVDRGVIRTLRWQRDVGREDDEEIEL